MYVYVLPLLLAVQTPAAPAQQPGIPVVAETSRPGLERYRIQLEGYRLEVEEGRRTRKLDPQTYLEAISTYKKGVADYRQMLKSPETESGQAAPRPPTTMEPIAQRHIETIRTAVADDVRTIRGAENPTVLERSLADARSEALRQLREPELEALRAYVRDRFPEPKEASAKWGADPNIKYQVATELEAQLTVLVSAVKDIVKSLTFESVPSQAKVSLRPKYGTTPRAELTRALFENVYRGLYVYEVTLVGHKPVQQELDLVNSGLGNFTCTLVPTLAAGESGCIRK